MGLLDKLAKKAGFELGEDETYQLSISIKNGNVNCSIDAVPDIENMTLDKLYSLQELLEEQLDELEARLEDLKDRKDNVAKHKDYKNWLSRIKKQEQALEKARQKLDSL